jgi:DNA-binding transcriptional LysR family regulator
MSRVDLSNVNLNLLVALDALLHEKSVTAAASRAHVTPSAMSHSLAELREILGDELLVRAGRGMTLTPRAESLLVPLHRILVEVEHIVRGGDVFDPRAASRHFVIAAPDFLATLLLPSLLDAVRRDAPNVTLEIVPSVRRGNAWLLETGEIDLALGAIVADAPGIRRMDLCTEGFACAVRRDHPTVRGPLTRETYAATPHLLITLGDDRRPTWIDEALAREGLSRRIAARVRYFMTAPLVVARSDLLVTGPSMLLRYFAELVPLRILEPPIALPTYPEEAYWHARFDGDPAHRWLRELLASTTKPLGIGGSPDRRSWNGELKSAQHGLSNRQRKGTARAVRSRS